MVQKFEIVSKILIDFRNNFFYDLNDGIFINCTDFRHATRYLFL